MDYQSLLARILSDVDATAYLTPSSHIDPRQRDAMAVIGRAIQARDAEPDAVRRLAWEFYEQGRIDRVLLLSALHVIAASPRVKDYAEAARLVGEQEYVSLQVGGPQLQDNLASVDRHRGVLAYLQGHYEVALDYFTRAFERQRTAENLGNILCALVRLGDVTEAESLYLQIRQNLPGPVVRELDEMVESDPDLALLRTES